MKKFANINAIRIAIGALVVLMAFAGAENVRGDSHAPAYVSNTGNFQIQGVNIGQNLTQAQQFTTGPQEGGYPLGSVGLRMFNHASNFSGVTVSIYSSVSNEPGVSLHTLTNPDEPVQIDGEALFTISPSVTLEASTSYFVVVASSTPRTSFMNAAISDNEDSGASPGWSIGDNRHFNLTLSDTIWRTSANALMIAVYSPPLLPAPANLQATPEDGAVVLTWDLPTSPPHYDTSYAYYRYSVVDSDDNEVIGDSIIPGSDRTTERFTVTGLENGEEYTFSVWPVRTVQGIQLKATATATPGVNTVAVKNVLQTSDGAANVGNSSGTNENAQGFATGVSAPQFILSQVIFFVDTAASVGTTFSAEIWSATTSLASDGLPLPDRRVVTLTGGDITSTGEVVFEAPDNTLLDASTTYFVVLSATGGDATSAYKVETTTSANEDDTPKPGWSILDKRHVKGANWSSQTGVILISVEVTRVPLPAAPANLQAESRHEKITLDWDNSDDDTITKYQYRIEERPDDDIFVWDLEWTDIPGSDSGTESHTIEELFAELVNGRKYAFQVRAWNSSGEGPPSERVDAAPRAAEIVLSTTSLAVAEGDSGTFKLRLATQPTAHVTVSFSSGDTDAATLSRSSVRFNTRDWNTDRTITVNGVNDDDFANETVKVSFAATGGDYAGVTTEMNVNVIDDELPDLTISDTSLRIREGGSDTFTVRLARMPSADVTVAVASDDTGAATVSASRLTFTATDWDTDQPVTVNAVEDSNSADETVEISLTASGDDYGAVSRLLTVFVTDDETAPAPTGRVVKFDASTYTVEEGGSSAEVTVEVSPAADSRLTFRLKKENLGGALASDYLGIPSVLTFWPTQSSKSFTVTAADDTDDDDGESVRIGFDTLPSGVSAGTPATVTVFITDDDRATLPDTVSGDTSTGATISAGQSWLNGNPVKGGIEHENDEDWYKTQLTAGHCYQIDIWGKTMVEKGYAEGLSLEDPSLKGIYNRRGNYLQGSRMDDGGGDGRTTRHTVRLDRSGTFFIAVTHQWNLYEGGGTFELSLTDLGTETHHCTDCGIAGLARE